MLRLYAIFHNSATEVAAIKTSHPTYGGLDNAFNSRNRRRLRENSEIRVKSILCKAFKTEGDQGNRFITELLLY
jgi:hypothetical protein